jgi:glycerol-3-phosphate dehydrogenase
MNLHELPERWDLVVIGGGITGAGIFREATRMGLKVLLVEKNDFAWGTSSRSSKMVHGGLRYLREGRLLLTKLSVEERERLLKDAPGLVKPLGFYMPVYDDQKPGKGMLKVGLSIYDWLASARYHRYLDAVEFTRKVPFVKQEGLKGGFYFVDAQVDDSRLVLRLIRESETEGSVALNYTAAVEIARDHDGKVAGVVVEDVETREEKTLETAAIVNATGCWAERLHPSPDPGKHLRPLRGSHLVFSLDTLPLKEGFSFLHPRDNRPIFAVPWEGAALVGTTDLDHEGDLSLEPSISEGELAYLMEGIQAMFPLLRISLDDCLSTYAGIRPILSEGKLSPSEESREHAVWVDRGLVTVTGGKLTTFRHLAFDTLKAAKPFLPPNGSFDRNARVFSEVPEHPENGNGLSPEVWRRLQGRYGREAEALVEAAEPEDLTRVPGTDTLWAELPWVARHEQVRHLGDLLLRRVRIGLLTDSGGKAHLRRIKKLCKPQLPWSHNRWREEIRLYKEQWNRAHGLPIRPTGKVAKWKARSRDAIANVLGRTAFRVWVTLSRGAFKKTGSGTRS